MLRRELNFNAITVEYVVELARLLFGGFASCRRCGYFRYRRSSTASEESHFLSGKGGRKESSNKISGEATRASNSLERNHVWLVLLDFRFAQFVNLLRCLAEQLLHSSVLDRVGTVGFHQILELFVLQSPIGDADVVGITSLLQALLQLTQSCDLVVERFQSRLLCFQVEFEVETRSWWGSRIYFLNSNRKVRIEIDSKRVLYSLADLIRGTLLWYLSERLSTAPLRKGGGCALATAAVMLKCIALSLSERRQM